MTEVVLRIQLKQPPAATGSYNLTAAGRIIVDRLVQELPNFSEIDFVDKISAEIIEHKEFVI